MQSVIKQALLHGTDPLLTPEALPERIRDATPADAASNGAARTLDLIASLVHEGLASGDNNLHAAFMRLFETGDSAMDTFVGVREQIGARPHPTASASIDDPHRLYRSSSGLGNRNLRRVPEPLYFSMIHRTGVH